MSGRRSNRAKKSVDYSKFGDGDDIDDDFRDNTPPPSKKQKISSKEKNEKKKDSTTTADDKRKRADSRSLLKEDMYEIELQAALELSMSESQSSQEAPTLELEPRVPDVEPHVVCISDENEPPPNLNKVEEPVKGMGRRQKQTSGNNSVVKRKSDPSTDEIEVLGTVYEEEEAQANSKRRAATSKATKIKSDDCDFDAEDESLDENGHDFDDEDFSEDDSDDSDFGDLGKKSKSKAKSKEKQASSPAKRKGGTVSANNKTAPLKPVPNRKKSNCRSSSPVNKEPCRTPGLSGTYKSPLTGVHIRSPNSSIRLGLSRNQRIKPLHPNINIQH